jgi:hypothetical protein
MLAAIAAVAGSWDADVLLLGSRHVGEWEAVIATSTSRDDARLGHRPVLIAGRRPGGRERPADN